MNAYTINTGETGAREIQEVGQYLTYWMPFVYTIREDGGLNSIDDTAMLQSAAAERIVPVMAITNFSATAAGSSLAHTILASTDIQDVIINQYFKSHERKRVSRIKH